MIPTETDHSNAVELPPVPADSACRQAGFGSCVVRVLDAVSTGIAVCDHTGTLLYLNPTGADILGVGERDVRGADIGEVFVPLALLEQTAARCESERSPEISVRFSDDRQLLIGYRIAATSGMTRVEEERQAVVLFQDITEFARIRQERDHLLRVATMSRLLPTIAHEIKNPLAGIHCLAEVLKQEVESQRQQEDLDAILAEVERLRLIVDGLGLANGSMLDGGKVESITDEIEDMVRFLSPRAAQLGISLRFKEQGQVRAIINRQMLRLVLVNLVNNAFDACSNGGEITLSCRREAGTLELEVRDTGCGMSAEQRQRAVELFYTTKPQGSGIGLALIVQVLQRAHGTMEIASEVGQGTTVTIKLPQERNQ